MRNTVKIGIDGERQVATALLPLLGNNVKLFNNVMFKTKSGTTQIDHLLVSTRGIFVIETKAQKGKIYGNANSKYWTQCLFGKGGVINRFSFYSPYFQNRGHLRSIISSLGTKSICGIICFTSANVDLSDVNCESVVHITLLLQFIYNIFISSPIADYNFNEMCDKITRLNIQSEYYNRKHINYVKSISK